MVNVKLACCLNLISKLQTSGALSSIPLHDGVLGCYFPEHKFEINYIQMFCYISHHRVIRQHSGAISGILRVHLDFPQIDHLILLASLVIPEPHGFHV